TYQSEHRWTDDVHAGIEKPITLPAGGIHMRSEFLKRRLEVFHPDIILCSGWTIPEYVAGSAFARERGATTVCCMDSQWGITVKRLASLPVSRAIVRTFDFFWVPGPLQARYARKLGFSKSRTLHGLYCCDTPMCREAARKRSDFLA